jgi:hypothetical protein
MRNKSAIIGICLLLVATWVCGCDQLITRTDPISVNVMVTVNILFLDADNTFIEKNTDGLTVTILIVRDGRDRLVFERIMQNGLAQATGNFELTTGAYIECNANIKDENHRYTQVFPGYAKLTWETVNASTNFGGVYNWYPKVTITLKE